MNKKPKEDWALGFFAILSFLSIPQYLSAGWIGLSWVLWLIWLVYFIPVKQK
jgi:hypothetical protein